MGAAEAEKQGAPEAEKQGAPGPGIWSERCVGWTSCSSSSLFLHLKQVSLSQFWLFLVEHCPLLATVRDVLTFLPLAGSCCAVLSCSLSPHGRSCNPPGSSVHGDSPGKNTGAGGHAFLQGIFPTQGSSPGVPHCRWILYRLSHQGPYKYTHTWCCA